MAKVSLDIKPRFFQEFKLTSDQIPEIGVNISIESVFNNGEIIDVTGTSKGHGFAGVVKRHGFKKQPILGSSDRVRRPGSIGAQTPGKVIKGKKMPGHYGNKKVTVSNLKIFKVDKDQHLLYVAGAVPGHVNSWVIITKL